MSRSGYSDDCDVWALIRWRGAVKSAIRGARGQAMLRELIQAHVSALVARWPAFDLATYLHQFRVASEYACGPGLNTGHLAESCLTRLTRALTEPQLQRNWLDLITFGIDGAQRTGATPADIVAFLEHMLTRFRNRAADLSARDPYEQTDHTARHTDVASREV